jgi:hypothetical protein
MKSCPNCSQTLEGEFCANCGQRDVDLERPIGDLLHELIRETLDVDGRAWRTLHTMFRHPGMLTTEFLAGKRRMYTSPLRLYIVVSVAFFIWAAWIASRGLLLDAGQTVDVDAGGQAQFLSEDLPRLMFALLPLFAVFLKIAFHKRLYFDHIIHSLHMHTVAYIVLALMLPLEEVAHWFLIALQTLIFAYFPVYIVVSMRRVYETGWMIAALKAFAVLFAYMVVVAIAIEGASNFRILSD